MNLSQFSVLLLATQLVLLAATMLLGPLFLRPRWIAYLLYTGAVGILWFAYAVVAMFFNSKAGHDVPGIGYLVIGFIGWIIGSVIFLFRIRRNKLE